ncbi:MAG TPA: hypothetical protein PKA05_17375, partial [Roseiflexaceae bacterium]|nr:hypothetical protein [Roseiflexaceae bacterium]
PGNHEWVELRGIERIADLSGWQIDDGPGGGAPFTITPGTQLAAAGYLVVTLPHALLNNGGDQIRLLRPDGSTADEYSYDNATRNKSHCRHETGWHAACEPTPGMANDATGSSTTAAAPSLMPVPMPGTTVPPPADASPADSADHPTTTTEPTAEALPTPRIPRWPTAGQPTDTYAYQLPGNIYTGVATATPLPTIENTRQPVAVPSPPAEERFADQPDTPLDLIAGIMLAGIGAISAGYLILRS